MGNMSSSSRTMLPLLALSALLFAPSGNATTGQADLSVGMKTLPLLTTKIEGSATVAILFDPASHASREEADDIKSIIDNGLEAPGDLKLNGVLVSVRQLDKMEGDKIAILTNGLSAYYDSISAAADVGGVLTMSTDLGCVRVNQCVLGIVSKPHVEIYFSKAAADAAKISFGQVFAMLVKKF